MSTRIQMPPLSYSHQQAREHFKAEFTRVWGEVEPRAMASGSAVHVTTMFHQVQRDLIETSSAWLHARWEVEDRQKGWLRR